MKEQTHVVEAKFVAGAVDDASLPPPTFAEIAFAGRSNVGKSSLLNALMGRRNLARTSNTPGATRQINVFEVRCADGLALSFVDLPGYGWAKRSKSERAQWQAMIDGYLTKRPSLRAVVAIVDVRRGVEDDDRQLVDFLRAERPEIEVVLVATKIDKLGAAARKPAIENLRRRAGDRAIAFSALGGDGREELWARIRHAAGLPGPRE